MFVLVFDLWIMPYDETEATEQDYAELDEMLNDEMAER